MDNLITVQNYSVLSALKNHEDGEIAYCTDEEKYYIYRDGWIQVEATMTNDGLKLNLYDLNKQIIGQLADFTEEQVNDLKAAINIWSGARDNKYYLLYGKEISYFTLFTEDNKEKEDYGLGEATIECLSSFEAIKEYDISEESIEIWIRNEDDITVLYLFGYDAGVVGYHG